MALPLPIEPPHGGHLRTVPAREASGPLAIETGSLTKRYGEIVAVDKLDLRVRQGEIYGFLGPNGAGKTTTIRMLLGLIAPTSGAISVMGTAPGTPESLSRIGAMIESPAFYPFLSGRDNLRMIASYTGSPTNRIDPVLAQVDLAGRSGDRFSAYSMGMKQRLGVAAALLKNPPLLMLDEPTNGLDPAGMADMRDLIRQLGQDGHTVLLSSHLMHEVEQVCDRVGVIAKGQIVAEGAVSDLRGKEALVIRVDQPDRARQILLTEAGAIRIQIDRGALRLEAEGEASPDAAQLNRTLVEAGIAVHELRRERRSLEQVFLDLTGEPRHD